jgi:hypothetical protein
MKVTYTKDEIVAILKNLVDNNRTISERSADLDNISYYSGKADAYFQLSCWLDKIKIKE